MDRFPDQFDARRYHEDEPVGFTAHIATRERLGPVDLPERIFLRLQSIATAYELHLLRTIEVYGTTKLNGVQCQVLAGELEFVADVVKDPLLLEYVGHLMPLVLACGRAGMQAVLSIEGP